MNRRSVIQSVVCLLCVSLMASAVLADSVRNKAGISYTGRIRGLSGSGIMLRSNNRDQTFPLAEIRIIDVAGLPGLKRAEELFDKKDYVKAVKAYGAVRPKAQKRWQRQYIDARLVVCYGQTGQFFRAAKAFINLCSDRSPLATKVELPTVPAKGSADNQAALKAIDQALATMPADPFADRLKSIRVNILLVEGDPADVLGIIEEQLKSPDRQTHNQARAKHIELLLDLNEVEKAGLSLAKAEKELNLAEDQPQLYFLRGRYQFAAAQARRKAAASKGEQITDNRDYLRAALNFMRVPVHFSLMRKTLASESLYWAALSMYRAKVPMSEAVVPLREAIRKFPNTRGAEKSRKLLKEISGEAS
ncbi:MAG: hypothetical protein GWP05_07735 [Anaerolineaceae bacterium]|nr:hypothetical protein [Anaerolineaceae bacterium]